MKIPTFILLFILLFTFNLSLCPEDEEFIGKVVCVNGNKNKTGTCEKYFKNRYIILKPIKSKKEKFVFLSKNDEVIVLANNKKEYKKNIVQINKKLEKAKQSHNQTLLKKKIKEISGYFKSRYDFELTGDYIRLKYQKNEEEIEIYGVVEKLKKGDGCIYLQEVSSPWEIKNHKIILPEQFELYVINENNEESLYWSTELKKQEELEKIEREKKEKEERADRLAEQAEREKKEKEKRRRNFLNNVRKFSKYDVQYRITGTCDSVDITYRNQYGGTEQDDNLALPIFIGFNTNKGRFLYISAQNQGKYGTVIVEIYIKGVLSKKAKSSGAYKIATVSGTY